MTVVLAIIAFFVWLVLLVALVEYLPTRDDHSRDSER